MFMSRFLLALPLAVALGAQVPAKPVLGLTPAQAEGVIQDLAANIPWLRKDFSNRKLFAALGSKGPNEDAKPLLPEEYLALPEDQRAQALHPDTAILLVLRLSRAAAWAFPEQARSEDWMSPVLARAQEVGNNPSTGFHGSSNAVLGGNPMLLASGPGRANGPSSPYVAFRRNLPDPDPRTGLDWTTRLVEPDRAARNFKMAHSSIIKYAPEMSYPKDDRTRAELENWVMARILVDRAEGAWDAPALRAQFLRLAAPRVPEWDTALAGRVKEAMEKLGVK